jgi:hypothetical protein
VCPASVEKEQSGPALLLVVHLASLSGGEKFP